MTEIPGLVDQLARAIYMTHWKPADPDSGRAGAPVWENASNNVRQWVTAQAEATMAVIPQAGYAIVPVEPTPAMMLAARETEGMRAVDGLIVMASVHGAALPDSMAAPNTPIEQAWRAMLAAYAAEGK